MPHVFLLARVPAGHREGLGLPGSFTRIDTEGPQEGFIFPPLQSFFSNHPLSHPSSHHSHQSTQQYPARVPLQSTDQPPIHDPIQSTSQGPSLTAPGPATSPETALRKSLHLLSEVQSLEETYVSRLTHLLTSYAHPLHASPNLIQPYTHRLLFPPSLHTIHATHQSSLLPALRSLTDPSLLPTTLLNSLLRHPALPQAYQSYIAHRTQNPPRPLIPSALNTFLRAVSEQTKHHLGLEELLIEPVQRFPRYILLLDALLPLLPQLNPQPNDHDPVQAIHQCKAIIHAILHDRSPSLVEAEEGSQREGTVMLSLPIIIRHLPPDLLKPHRRLLHIVDVFVPQPFESDPVLSPTMKIANFKRLRRAKSSTTIPEHGPDTALFLLNDVLLVAARPRTAQTCPPTSDLLWSAIYHTRPRARAQSNPVTASANRHRTDRPAVALSFTAVVPLDRLISFVIDGCRLTLLTAPPSPLTESPGSYTVVFPSVEPAMAFGEALFGALMRLHGTASPSAWSATIEPPPQTSTSPTLHVGLLVDPSLPHSVCTTPNPATVIAHGSATWRIQADGRLWALTSDTDNTSRSLYSLPYDVWSTIARAGQPPVMGGCPSVTDLEAAPLLSPGLSLSARLLKLTSKPSKASLAESRHSIISRSSSISSISDGQGLFSRSTSMSSIPEMQPSVQAPDGLQLMDTPQTESEVKVEDQPKARTGAQLKRRQASVVIPKRTSSVSAKRPRLCHQEETQVIDEEQTISQIKSSEPAALSDISISQSNPRTEERPLPDVPQAGDRMSQSPPRLILRQSASFASLAMADNLTSGQKIAQPPSALSSPILTPGKPLTDVQRLMREVRACNAPPQVQAKIFELCQELKSASMQVEEVQLQRKLTEQLLQETDAELQRVNCKFMSELDKVHASYGSCTHDEIVIALQSELRHSTSESTRLANENRILERQIAKLIRDED